MRWGKPGLAGCVVWGLLAASSVAQTPRRIDPDRFPDYGIRAEPAPAAPGEPFQVELPTDARPLGACERAMPSTLWLRCLRETANAADDALAATVARIKFAFETRRDASPVLRTAWGRALDENLNRFRALRDQECQQLAMAEPGASRELLQDRYVCQIARNRERAAELLRRYGVGTD